ncbi:MAG: DNA gyrase inhibitor YacG [Myxococcales bacterium FL481]|nr:MAG: DNA gyrase inhibitor YacG [Myxococcales bacterium FL481]
MLRLRCPTCAAERVVPRDWPARPFCSERCKLVDLGRWLDEDYRLSRPVTDDDHDS